MGSKIFYSILFWGLVLILWGCKSLEYADDPVNNREKQEAISPDDIIQPMTFSELNLDDRVFKGQLENGLTYYIMPNEKPDDRAELRLVVNVGSIDEDYDQLGVAHFIEHMAFNGTEHFEKNELVDYLESVGTRFGPDLNAYTSFDETVYMLQVRTDVEEQLKKGLLVLSDWASGMKLTEEEIDKERGVVISEWRTQLSANQRMQKEYLPVLLKGSRYAQRLPIGDPEIIENADYRTIRRFYNEWYRPDLMAVVAVGDFNPALIEDYIVEYFSEAPKAISPRVKKSYPIGDHDDNTLVKIVTDPEAAITQVRIINKLPETEMVDLGDFRERLISRLFTQMLNARLSELTQSMESPFLYASCYYGPDIGPMNSYVSFAASKEGELDMAIKTLIRENERVAQHGFTHDELERAKAILLKSADNVLKESDKMESAKLVNRYVQHFLRNRAYISPEDYHSLVNKYVPGIKLNLVNSKTQWFQDSNRVVIVTAPESEKPHLPSNKDILTMFEDVRNKSLDPYLEEAVNKEPLLSLKPSSPQIVDTLINQELGIKTLKLANGAKVMFKPTAFNNDQILFKSVARGGHAMFNDEEFINATHASWIVRESGIGEYSNIALEKKLAGKKVSIRPYMNQESHGLTGNSGVEEAELLGQLIYLFFTDVRRDSAIFASFKDRMISYYGNLMSDPSYYFSNEVARITSDDNFRVMFPSSEDLEKLDYQKVFDHFESIMADPGEYHFIFTGNLDDKTENMLLSYIGAIPEESAMDRDDHSRVHIPDPQLREWNKGQAPKSYVEVRHYVKLDTLTQAREDDLDILKNILDIKLRESLREDMSGVYGVRTFMTSRFLPEGAYLLGYSFVSDPGMTQELIDTAAMVFQTIHENGPDPEDIEKVKVIERQKLERDLETNDFWMRTMVDSVTDELDLDRASLSTLNERLSRIDASYLKDLMKEIVTQSNVVTFIQNPE
ncbi:MAG: insulinase family protein [Saprospiraceae bacterium]|nr:insulinase family protein [Saprospiraceae bacterium]